MVEDSGRGYRLVVASPIPQRILETDVVQMLLEEDVIVIAVGGGGIPVVIEPDGTYEGVEVVVDKDYASSVLARDLRADLFIVLTGVDKIAINLIRPIKKPLIS
jgi:carbamate kinase